MKRSERPMKITERMCVRCGYRTSFKGETVCPRCGRHLVKVTEDNKEMKPLYD